MIKYIKMYYRRFKYDSSKKKISKLQQLASDIGDYYLSIQEGVYKANYDKARFDIVSMGISNLDVKGNRVMIRLTRPGLLIGRKGSNIDAMKDFLSKKYKKNIVIDIEEDKVLQYLIPYSPEDCDLGL
jgi:ribosomal protein S3